MGGRFVGVQGLRQDAVAQGLDHLDDPGHPGGGLGVPDVRLEGAEPQRAVGVAALPVGGEEGLCLDRVAEPGPGAVGLHGVHVGRVEAGVGEGLADDALLGGAVGGGQAAARAVLVDGRAADDGEHLVPVAQGVGEALHQDHAGALGPAGAVGAVGERLAAAVGGQPALAAELDEDSGGGHHRRPAGEGEVALAPAQGLDGQVKGDQ